MINFNDYLEQWSCETYTHVHITTEPIYVKIIKKYGLAKIQYLNTKCTYKLQ